MKHNYFIAFLLPVSLAACSEMPKMFWGVDEGVSSHEAKGTGAAAPERPPLVMPPSLQGKVTVPMADKVATRRVPLSAARIAPSAKRMVVGKAVALDARAYPVEAAVLFSSVVDAMTALNIPVESVDSPSGTITSDWIRKDAASNAFPMIASAFGRGAPQAVRYRFVVRVLRQEIDGKPHARLEVRTLGQEFRNRHWVNRSLKRKLSNELFSAVEERISSQPVVR